MVGTILTATVVRMTTSADASPAAPRASSPAGTPNPVLDVVIPVYNEETDLAQCVYRLHTHLRDHVPYAYRITIADNASTDSTLAIARGLAEEIPEVEVVHLDEKGRGRALNAVWSASDAQVLVYMDVDLSTDLAALLPLVAPLISGHSDLAIGSRLARGARVVRRPKREIISRCYNLILRGTLAAKFSDAQCGFKAIRADVARQLLPLVEDTGWFFDTELLVLAQRAGLRTHEVPVDWIDDPDSSVNIVATATADLKGVARMIRAFAKGSLPLSEIRAQLGRAPIGVSTPGVPPRLATQLVRFAAIGVGSTLAYLVLYVLLRGAVGAQWANLVSLLVTAIANTAANRRFTFGVRGSAGAGRHQFEGLIVFGLGLALTSGSLALLHSGGEPNRFVELVVLVLANLAATVLRFLLFRNWVFRKNR
ncbi:GtrA-like protein [Amycolatopsis sacchari]|uniref:dolichyl-phosphate beta-glucosyltransferase n=2 Tax=Pseudonocardiaceae TaxID=2070 RepID=A0A1I3U3P5_9PSEU|nr:GtrA-like protein [Amycolatopsis sacchari]